MGSRRNYHSRPGGAGAEVSSGKLLRPVSLPANGASLAASMQPGPAVSPLPFHLATAGQAPFRNRDRHRELLRLASVANSLLASSGF